MKLAYTSPEINYHTLRLIVGVIALSLAVLTSALSGWTLDSISAAYHHGGAARDVFVGFLFAIGAFLLAYNGYGPWDMIWAKVAAAAAVGVAMVPCDCGMRPEAGPMHYLFAAALFSVLAWYCWGFYRRARGKDRPRARLRARIYAVCGIVIVLSMAVLLLDAVLGGALRSRVRGLVFYGEHAVLVAFGVSWLVASRTLPGLTTPSERIPLLPDAGKAAS